MASLFDILINIATNTASFESGMQRVEARLSAIGDLAKSALEFTGITVGLSELQGAFEAAAKSGEQLTQLSARMGTSIQSLSQLQYAAQATDIPFQAMTGALDAMSRNLVQASEGSGKAKAAFHDLGIDTAALAAVPLDQQLSVIADKIAALPNPTQQTAAAMRIFGEAGADMLPILQQGAAGIEELRQRADALGVTLSPNTVGALAAANSAITDLHASTHAFWMELASEGAPALSSFTNAVVKNMTDLRQMTDAKFGIGDSQSQIQGLVAQAQELSDRIDNLNSRKGWLSTLFDAPLIRSDTSLLADLTKQIADAEAKLASATVQKPYTPDELQPVDVGASYIDHSIDLRPLTDVTVTATKTLTDYMQQYYNSLDDMSKTDVERTVDDWNTKEDAVKQLLADGVISATEAATRIQALNEQFLQPVAVTAQYIVKTAKANYDEMDKYARTAANSIQQEFASFLADPSIASFKAMGVAWLQTIEKMVADAAAQDLFGALFKGGNSQSSGLEGLLGSLLGGAFGGGVNSAALGASASAAVDTADFSGLPGFANGGSFDTGGSGGTDSQLVAFKSTPGEHVQVGTGSGGDVYITNQVTVTSPEVTKSDVIQAMQLTQTSTVAKLQDMKRRNQF